MYDYLIIGAGVTGVTLCKKLKEKGITNVIVLEAEEKPGGLCTTKNIDGHILDTGGGHFFGTKIDEVYDYVFKHISKEEFNFIPRVSKQLIGNTTIDYPIESNLWQLPVDECIAFLISVIRNGEALGLSEPKNYEEWIRWKLGDKICDEYMIPYNSKLWGVSPDQMDIDWLYKIPRVNVDEILRYCLDRKQDTGKFPAHIGFYYPKHGGFQRIFDALYKDEQKNVICNARVNKIWQSSDGPWVINDKYHAKRIINTAPWNDLYDALGADIPECLRSDLKKYNTIEL